MTFWELAERWNDDDLKPRFLEANHAGYEPPSIVKGGWDTSGMTRGMVLKEVGIVPYEALEGLYEKIRDRVVNKEHATHQISLKVGDKLFPADYITLHEFFHGLDDLVGRFNAALDVSKDETVDDWLRNAIKTALESLQWDPKLGLEGVRFSDELGARAGLSIMANMASKDGDASAETMNSVFGALSIALGK